MRYTAVFEFPEGQKPAVGKKDSWLGGELVALQFSDALDNVVGNSMPIPTPTQHKALANLNKLLAETDSEAWVYVKNFILFRPDIPPPLTPYNGPITNLNYQELTNIAKERANKEAALMYPEGELREKEAKRLAHKHFYQLTRKTV